MPELVLESLDGVPQALHSHFQPEGEGKFTFRPEGFVPKTSHEEMVTRQRGRAESLSKDLAAWRALGESPEEVAAALSAAVDPKPKPEGDDGGAADLRREHELLVEKHSKAAEDLAGAQAELDKLKRQNWELEQASSLRAALPENFVSEAWTDLVHHARQWLVEEDGKQVCRNPENGKIVAGSNADGYATHKEWLEYFLPNFKPHYLLKTATGGDSGGGAGGPQAGRNLKRKAMTPAQKADFISKNGPEAYEKLPWE